MGESGQKKKLKDEAGQNISMFRFLGLFSSTEGLQHIFVASILSGTPVETVYVVLSGSLSRPLQATKAMFGDEKLENRRRWIYLNYNVGYNLS